MKKSETKISGKNIYVGETSRSLYERSKEHVRDGKKRVEDSHIAKHWDEFHQVEEMPEFRFRIVKRFQDSLSRQVSESVRIDLREEVLNSKTVYSRNRLPRLEVEKTDWEKEDEVRQKRKKQRQIGKKRKKEKMMMIRMKSRRKRKQRKKYQQ